MRPLGRSVTCAPRHGNGGYLAKQKVGRQFVWALRPTCIRGRRRHPRRGPRLHRQHNYFAVHAMKNISTLASDSGRLSFTNVIESLVSRCDITQAPEGMS